MEKSYSYDFKNKIHKTMPNSTYIACEEFFDGNMKRKILEDL